MADISPTTIYTINIHISKWKLSYSTPISLKFIPKNPKWNSSSIGLDHGLSRNERYMHHSASMNNAQHFTWEQFCPYIT